MIRHSLIGLMVLIALASCGRKLAPSTVPGTLFSNVGASNRGDSELDAELESRIAAEAEITGEETSDDANDAVLE